MSQEEMPNWTESLTDEQKQQVWDFIVFTVKEIRNEIANDIYATSYLWKHKGLNKSRRTQKAFEISAAIARGQHETREN
jgi:ribosomal protein S17E